MKTVKIAELKDHLSEHIRAVERGSEVTVTDRNRPVARIVPIGAPTPVLAIVSPKIAFKSIREKRWRASRWSARSLDLLADERSER
jgi:prevent-host-death family protein